MAFKLKNPDAPMSYKQGIMIRNGGGGDVRGQGLTQQDASDRIRELLLAKDCKLNTIKIDYVKLWRDATSAGHVAGEGSNPTPMTVVGGGQEWHVSEGACGFAWVNFKMKKGLGCKFGQWLIAEGHARKDSYYGGVTVWISDHGQSIDRKSAHAAAMAKVLQEAGIEDAYPASRMD